MAIITTDNQHYADIAAAIRDKNGSETQYRPDEMAAAIAAISGGGSGGGGEIKIFRTTQTGTITVPDDFTDIRQLLCASSNSNYNGTWFFDGDNYYSESKDILYGIGAQVYTSPDGCAYYDDAAGRYNYILKNTEATSAYTAMGARLVGNKLSIVENFRLSNTPISSSGDKVIFYRV